MDPASLAFGVVSLAMQLMQTTTAIKKLITDYKSAAKDLAVLSDKLDDIEAVCRSLEVVLANFDAIRNPWETTLLNKLYKAISDCRDKVSLAYDAVHKVTARRKNGRASLATVGSLVLQHRARIRQCNDDLDRSLSSLQLHMTTNLLAANMRPSVLPRRGHVLISAPSVVEGQSTETVSVTNRNRTFSSYKDSSDTLITQWRWGWSALGYLQTTRTLKTTTGFSETDSLKTDEDLSFLIGVPILKLYLKLSVRRGSLSPLSASLHFPHVIDTAPGSSEIGDRLVSALFYDDAEAVRDYFCKGLLTPFSTMAWSLYRDADDETTFYGVRETLEVMSANSWLNNFQIRCKASFGLKQLLFDYIDMRGDSLTPLEVLRALNELRSARDLKIFVEYCKQRFSDDWWPFNLRLYSYLVGMFELSYSMRPCDLLDDWAPVLADVLSNGVDIHTSTWLDKPLTGRHEGFSAVHRIISNAESPQMALERCSLWLNLLEQVGVDIEEYLDVEINHCIATWDQKSTENGTEFRKIFTVQEYGGRRMPCWIQEIDGACPIRELLLEFPHFQKRDTMYRFDLDTSTTSELHRAWKDPMTQKCLDGSSP
ncbi:uncharacterized protein NECHADRAFT_86862 [Fusarium vanettenii 77-13-4]|uniref:Fungal N-terminal domain-containing protein n=1 Tax=Fusarium vanettenii (strain ATCC MYA-4622 / CBS 123669 / FGSC 9596 / NRRL 45880 / 77-13-4) TaxID=660122 RepID=C7ZK11_FUSV7|nr:uncharacterized protein NECHADRAFT_86862 [Fusarium vanettenii 77-13-4]EEU35645.1 hypothetical protein NECHADRAFT_86862 [Fusarium vanettenii 77-13-4]